MPNKDRALWILLSFGAIVLVILFGGKDSDTTPPRPRAEPEVQPLAPPPAAPPRTNMVELLARLAQTGDVRHNIFLNRARVETFARPWLAQKTPNDFDEQVPAVLIELLNANENRLAAEVLQRPELQHSQDEKIELLRGLTWLRIGEQENCVHHHTTDSCLLPIQKGAVHQKSEGSKTARDHLLKFLQREPDHLIARWLVNLAAMTLGEHPESLPEKHVIPVSAFDSEYEMPRFRDVAKRTGLGAMGMCGGGIVDDFNGDHLLDFMVSGWGLKEQMRFFINRGDGKFDERTEQAGLIGQVGGLNLSSGDYNRDGHLDVLVLRGAWLGPQGQHPNSLLRNNGDGTFTDVTIEAGLFSLRPTQTGVWFDYNNDGWLDLFIGNEQESERLPVRSELYLNNRDGTFREASAEAGIEINAMVKGATAADYDNDGYHDLYVSILHSTNRLYRNLGPNAAGRWRFEDVTAAAGVAEPKGSFPCWFFDYDNDGWEDLLVLDYGKTKLDDIASAYLGNNHSPAQTRLYRNNRQGGFDDVSKGAGLGKSWMTMGSNFGDLDNDGFLDFYLGTGVPELIYIIPNVMYRNDGGRRFQNVSTSGGFGHLQKGHAVSFADFDNDGDQDVHSVMGGAFEADAYMNVLFENPGTTNNWLKLKLTGTASNHNGRGARVRVFAESPDRSQVFHRTVGTGGSFGCNPVRQEIGLGNATQITRVEITWPATRKVQIWNRLKPNHFYELTEDKAEARRIDLPRVATD